MLGHELRNPLAPILTALQLMRLRAGSALENERIVIERQTRHLVRLVDDLLDVSRIARGKIELRRERVELADVVAKAIEMASPLLEERSTTCASTCPRGLGVDGDPARLAQVLANLLTNAAKYTETGGAFRSRATRGDERPCSRCATAASASPRDAAARLRHVRAGAPGARADAGRARPRPDHRAQPDRAARRHASRPQRRTRTGQRVRAALPVARGASGPRRRRAAAAGRAIRTAHAVLIVDDNADAAEMLSEYVAAWATACGSRSTARRRCASRRECHRRSRCSTSGCR
jgi:signal transduction histidine kinase